MCILKVINMFFSAFRLWTCRLLCCFLCDGVRVLLSLPGRCSRIFRCVQHTIRSTPLIGLQVRPPQYGRWTGQFANPLDGFRMVNSATLQLLVFDRGRLLVH